MVYDGFTVFEYIFTMVNDGLTMVNHDFDRVQHGQLGIVKVEILVDMLRMILVKDAWGIIDGDG